MRYGITTRKEIIEKSHSVDGVRGKGAMTKVRTVGSLLLLKQVAEAIRHRDGRQTEEDQKEDGSKWRVAGNGIDLRGIESD